MTKRELAEQLFIRMYDGNVEATTVAKWAIGAAEAFSEVYKREVPSSKPTAPPCPPKRPRSKELWEIA